jgi:uncharacterized membrane protein SpoIIM required for sporulation
VISFWQNALFRIMKRLSRDSIKPLYIESRATVREAKYFILFAVFLFCCGLLVGWVRPISEEAFFNRFQPVATKFHELGAVSRVLWLFVHNGIGLYLSLLSGVVFGLGPAFASVYNGLAVGWTLGVGTNHLSLTTVAVAMVPHGIFELPACFLGWGFGIWWGAAFSAEFAGDAKARLKAAHKVFLLIVLPLLAVAAVIEGSCLFKP